MGSRAAFSVLLAAFVLSATIVVISTGPASSGPSALPAASASAPPVVAPLGSSRVVEVAPGFSLAAGDLALGPVPPSTPMDVAVGLALQNSSSLAADLMAMYLPGSSMYHHYLSTSELARQFGPSVAALAAAASYFDSYGLHVVESPDHLLLDVSGPADEVGPAFGTSFEELRLPGGSQVVTHLTPASLPNVAPWSGVLGLGNTTPLRPATLPLEVGPLASPEVSCSGGSDSGPFIPCQVWNAYNMTGPTPSSDGTGETIGIVDTYDAQQTEVKLQSDLTGFDANYGLPNATVNYLYPVGPTGGLNTTTTGWSVEEALDLEWVHASAPGATIDMTFSPNPNVGLYQAVDYLVAHQSVNVISMSWGEPDVGITNAYSTPCSASCNASTDGSYDLLGPVLEFAAAEGISVFAASGDCGAADGTSGVSTNFPASDPYVTGVGGTELTLSSEGGWGSETGWYGNASGAVAPGCENQGGSGGGYAPFSAPWWQQGDGLPTGSHARGVPDVAAVSSPGVYIYYNGEQLSSGIGGTSLSTPIWAGIAARADQRAGAPLGLLNPSLYAILENPGEYASDFHDILAGNNGYPAGAGWDPDTGIGTPIVSALLPELAAGPPENSTVRATLNVSTSSGVAPLSVDFSVSATGGTGNYTGVGVYFGDGTASFAPHGLVDHTYSTAGVYSAQAYVVDSSGNFTVSLPVALVVGGGSAIGVNLSANSTSPRVDAPVAFTSTPEGGVGPFDYLYYFGDGTYENWTTDPVVSHAYGAAGSFCAIVLIRDSAVLVDGGISQPVPIGAGGEPAPECAAAPAPLHVAVNSTEGVRDAPADFPALFNVSGGSGTVSLQFRSSDPYVAACACDILRSEGNYTVRLYANESIGPPVVSEANVTVAPPLSATFTTSRTFGRAPFVVWFNVSASGGFGANASATSWSFGNGGNATGASVEVTYVTAGLYWAVGHLSDRGHGNASRAFLIDIAPSAPSAAPYLAASVAPVVDVPSGTAVVYTASADAWNFTATAANFTWTDGPQVVGYAPSIARTVYAPAANPGGFALGGDLSAVFATTGASETVGFSFPSFFAVEGGEFVPSTDALVLAATGGPAGGPGPLFWSGAANAAGPGSITSSWVFGDGTNATTPTPAHTYWTAGRYTIVGVTEDSWGDVADYATGVDVTSNGVPLTVVASPSDESGPAPLTVEFTAVASGGAGGPYGYTWEFGDGGDASAANVTHVYSHEGSFTANITVRDIRGGSFTRVYTITVTAPGATGPVLGFLPRSVSLGALVVVAGLAVGVVLAIAAGRGRRSAAIIP
ncbi:MAG TPA: PKD domain-containing protein [Thermoplasmata archaeon]|nr:PKD domain-containing protein [Thermoplasmata archaeon]